MVGRSKDGSRTVSVITAAEILGVTKQTIYALIKKGDIHALRLGSRLVIPRKVLANMLGEGENNEEVPYGT